MRVEQRLALVGDAVGQGQPDRRTQLEAVAAAAAADEEAAARGGLVEDGMPVGRDIIQRGVAPGAVAPLHGRVALDEPLARIEDEVRIDRLAVTIRIDDGVGFLRIDQPDQSQVARLGAKVGGVDEIDHDRVDGFLARRPPEERHLDATGVDRDVQPGHAGHARTPRPGAIGHDRRVQPAGGRPVGDGDAGDAAAGLADAGHGRVGQHGGSGPAGGRGVGVDGQVGVAIAAVFLPGGGDEVGRFDAGHHFA